MFGDNRPPSFQQRLRNAIDAALEQQPATFEDFLDLMRGLGVTVMDEGKHLKFLAPPMAGLPNQIKPTRCDTLKGDYTVAAIRERIAGQRDAAPKKLSIDVGSDSMRRPSLLIDIQAKMQEGKGAGYERWAKLHNLKSMAATLIYLQERSIDSYDDLCEKSSAASTQFNDLSGKIKDLDTGLTANAALQKQIVTYSKTRNTYVEYRKAGYSQKFKAANEADIILHQAAKKYFDDLGYGKGKKLPTVASLRAEYAMMLDEKKQAYRGYKQSKSDMQTLLTAKSNVDNLLNITDGGTPKHGRNEPTL